jgi:hypothetical protein
MSGRENRSVDPWDLPQDPTLEQLLRHVARNIKLSIRTHVPAAVIAYDATRQRATVQVQILQVVRIVDPARVPTQVLTVKGRPPNAEGTLKPLQLFNIPVVWPRTNAGYITFPLAAGDTGELHVSDRSLELWMQQGIPTDPQLAFTHALKDSVFHPGLHSDTNPIVPPTDATATVVEGTASVKIGSAAIDAIARAPALLAVLDAFVGATPVPNDGGLALQTAVKAVYTTANQRALIAALKGKVE